MENIKERILTPKDDAKTMILIILPPSVIKVFGFRVTIPTFSLSLPLNKVARKLYMKCIHFSNSLFDILFALKVKYLECSWLMFFYVYNVVFFVLWDQLNEMGVFEVNFIVHIV